MSFEYIFKSLKFFTKLEKLHLILEKINGLTKTDILNLGDSIYHMNSLKDIQIIIN